MTPRLNMVSLSNIRDLMEKAIESELLKLEPNIILENMDVTEKVMYCYNCTASSDAATKTISTTCTSSSPTKNCSKSGDGHAIITYIGE